MTAPLSDQALRDTLAARYSLVREIGAGGMATVYLAHDLRHDRKVALKVLRPELAAVIGAERFLIEIRTTANLQHPHILPLFDSGQVNGTVFYVMPFVEGESLRDRLTRDTQLPVAEALRIATEVASALDYAHRRGVIHRDIKPENILLHDGQAQVADFGIAFAANSAGATRLTETGMSLGTPQYMSPEQAMGERTLDARTDIYALACVLYEMLIGEPPFTGPTAQAIVARVITTRPSPPTEQRQTVPPHVSDAVMTALEKLPADRFATAAAFATALATPSLPVGHATAAHVTALWRTPAIAGVVGAALGAFGLWASMPKPEPEARPIVRFEIIGDSAHPLELNCCGLLFAIAPDERTIVFQSRERGDSLWGLYARDLASSTVRPIPGTAIGPRGLFFSPDGEQIGFAAEGRIQTVRLSGGALERVADLPGGFIAGGTWTTDDRIIYAAGGTLYVVNASGGELQVLARPDSARGERELVAPHYVPGADAILHTVVSRGAKPPRIGIIWLGDKRRKDIAEGSSPAFVERGRSLVFVRTDGQLDAIPFDPDKGDTAGPARRLAEAVQLRSPVAAFGEYAVSPRGTIVRVPRGGAGRPTTLALVDEQGRREILTLPVRSEHHHGGTFSPDGHRLAVMIADVNNATHSLYVYDIAAGTAVRIGSSDERGVFAWAGTSDSLLVVSGGAGLIAVPADRPFAGHTVSSLQGWNGVRRVSVRGPWVVFSGTAPSGRSNDLAWFHRDSSTSIHTYAAEGYNEDNPALSPNARWVAYTSDETGAPQVHLSGFPVAGRRVAVSVGEGMHPRWSGDGRTLYYIAGSRYAAVDVSEIEARLELTNRRFIPQFGPARTDQVWDVDPTRTGIVTGAGSVWAGDRLLVELNAAASVGR